MDSSATILVIILSSVLALFLVLATILAILLIRISRQIKQIAQKADIVVTDAGSVVSNVKKLTTSVAAAKAAATVIKNFKGGKNVKK